MEWLRKLSAAIDYIENHLTEDIPIDKLAETASLSPFYFQRLSPVVQPFTFNGFSLMWQVFHCLNISGAEK